MQILILLIVPLHLITDMSQLTDYNFVCWVDKDGNEIQVPETMPAKDLIFFAKCEKITKSEKYDISVIYEEDKFDCNVSLSVNGENGTGISDSQKITVKNNLWLRIISFFKNLFRINRDVVQSVFESTK